MRAAGTMTSDGTYSGQRVQRQLASWLRLAGGSDLTNEQIETVVIGGGQAGLAMSYYLGQLGHEHIVLERHRVAERWRSERWDSLTFQFPNWTMHLPNHPFRGANPNDFAPR